MKFALIVVALIFSLNALSDELIFDRREFQVAIRDPEIIKKINVEAVTHLAKALSVSEALAISKYGGVRYFRLNTGCIHKCTGCVLRCDMRSGFSRMSWENFTTSIDALVGLQTILNDYYGWESLKLINKETLYTYYNSDPMSTKLLSKEGVKTNLDAMKYLKEKTGVSVAIATAGWVPRDPVIEGAAKELFEEIKSGNASYLRRFIFELKPFTAEFINDIKLYMYKILPTEKSFVSLFKDDYERFGLDFTKYKEGVRARFVFKEIVIKHREQILDSSHYIKDRLENIRTIYSQGLTRELSRLLSIQIYYGFDAEDELFDPFLTRGVLESYFNKALIAVKADVGPIFLTDERWRFLYVNHRHFPTESPIVNAVVLNVNGSISFDTGGADRYFMAKSERAAIRSLAYRPILFDDPRSPWLAAAEDRLDGTWDSYLTERELQSIESEILKSNAKPEWIESLVSYDIDPKGSYHPYVRVKVGEKILAFNFKGQLVTPPMREGVVNEISYRGYCAFLLTRILRMKS